MTFSVSSYDINTRPNSTMLFSKLIRGKKSKKRSIKTTRRRRRKRKIGKGIFDGTINRAMDRGFNKLGIKNADDAINKLTSSLINNAIDIPAGRIKNFAKSKFKFLR